jgi:hypothetical protein
VLLESDSLFLNHNATKGAPWEIHGWTNQVEEKQEQARGVTEKTLKKHVLIIDFLRFYFKHSLLGAKNKARWQAEITRTGMTFLRLHLSPILPSSKEDRPTFYQVLAKKTKKNGIYRIMSTTFKE